MRARVNRIRHCMAQGRISRGINVQTASPEIVEMVGVAGYDHVMIDWEHGSFDFDTVVQMIRAADAVDLTPVVRVPDVDAVAIKRVLDAGALGVVVPQVSTVEQAREALGAARYFDGRNAGARGACPSVRATGHLSTHWEQDLRHANEQVVVALSFECTTSIANFDAIAALPGLDAAFVGAFDLAQSMGHLGQTRHPDVQQQLERLHAHARANGVPLWGTLMSGDAASTAAETAWWVAAGAAALNVASDRRLLSLALAQRLAASAPPAP